MAGQSREINEEQQVVVAEGNNRPRQFRCQHCDRVFRNSHALGGHQNGHRRERAAARRIQQELQCIPVTRNPRRTVNRRLAVAQPAVAQPAVSQPAVVQPEVPTLPPVTQPAVVQPAVVQPVVAPLPPVTQPAVAQPAVASLPPVTQPAVAQPAVVQPAVSPLPPVTEPEVAQPAMVQPAVAPLPPVTQPAVAHPAVEPLPPVPQPAVVQPAVEQLAGAQLAVVQPAVAPPAVATPARTNPPRPRPVAARTVPTTYPVYQYRDLFRRQARYLPSLPALGSRVQPRHYYGGTVAQRLQDRYVNGYSFSPYYSNVGGAYERWRLLSERRTPNPWTTPALPYPHRVLQQPTVAFAGSVSSGMQDPSGQMNAVNLQMNPRNNHDIEPNAAGTAEILSLPAPPAVELAPAPPVALDLLSNFTGGCTCGQEEIDLELRL